MDDACAGEICQNPNKEEFNYFKVKRKGKEGKPPEDLKTKNLCLGFMETK